MALYHILTSPNCFTCPYVKCPKVVLNSLKKKKMLSHPSFSSHGNPPPPPQGWPSIPSSGMHPFMSQSCPDVCSLCSLTLLNNLPVSLWGNYHFFSPPEYLCSCLLQNLFLWDTLRVLPTFFYFAMLTRANSQLKRLISTDIYIFRWLWKEIETVICWQSVFTLSNE